MSALKYWIWLSSLEKIGLKKKLAALRWFGEPEAVYKADKRSLKMVEELTAGDIERLPPTDIPALPVVFTTTEPSEAAVTVR